MKNTLRFKVEGMTCVGCARSVRQALESVRGVTAERVVTGEPVEVRFDADRADPGAIAAAVERAGYRPVFD